jgi:hypothetical protein
MVVLLVDALGWELARARPGCFPGLEQRRRLETILGFSSGALPTIFTGALPREHGRWLMYQRARNGTPFANFGALAALPKRVRQSPTMSRLLTRVVSRRGVRGYFHLYDVPRERLPEFDLAERGDIFAPGGLPGVSLWDALERRRIAWRGWNWRTQEAQNLADLIGHLERSDASFLFCYTADLDALLHREGSRGEGVRDRLKRYEEFVTRVLDTGRRGAPVWLYVLSDHGMVDVTRTADLAATLDALPYRAPHDYLSFLDSTVVRFWWRNAAARGAVESALAASGAGRWLTPADLEAAGCDFADHRYGESLFLLDPGVLLVPSFMGSSPLAAMHGYDPAHPDMAAGLWSNRPIGERVRHLSDLRAHFESELDALAGEAA